MKKLITRFTVIFVVVFAMLATGCPKADKTVRAFKEKSAELSIYGGKLIGAFGDAYKAKEITQMQLIALNGPSEVFVKAVGIYRQALAEAERLIKDGQPFPTGTLNRLQRIFDDQVVAAFFQVLSMIGVLSISQSEVIKTVISAIRLLILTIQGSFGSARDMLKTLEVKYGTMA